MDYAAESLKMHKRLKGKLEVASKAPVKDKDQLSVAYTPGVAEPCRKIGEDPDAVYEYTIKGNYIGVVTDGTAVLGLGDIGPAAALPVMEGKCVLFKTFGGVDAVPICLDAREPDRIVETVAALAPAFGGFNLEDISAPRCFEIEERLKERLSVPVFHDDQHGTAVVVLGGLINALKLKGKSFGETTAVISGAGAAGVSIAGMLRSFGIGDVVLCDRKGAIHKSRTEGMNGSKRRLAETTNFRGQQGSLEQVIRGKDVFIGVSGPGTVTGEMVRSMNPDPVIFAMSNPVPEIFPEEAALAGARIIGTGRSDFPNQINNVLAFPGIFRGALDVRAREINEAMKMAAARALARLVPQEELSPEYIIPRAFDPRVGPRVAAAVAEAAVESGAARIPLTYGEALERASRRMGGGGDGPAEREG